MERELNESLTREGRRLSKQDEFKKQVSAGRRGVLGLRVWDKTNRLDALGARIDQEVDAP